MDLLSGQEAQRQRRSTRRAIILFLCAAFTVIVLTYAALACAYVVIMVGSTDAVFRGIGGALVDLGDLTATLVWFAMILLIGILLLALAFGTGDPIMLMEWLSAMLG
jgi:hypothetical protein